ncbi:MAG: DUF4493 domain-containing protein [Bacteroidaceae bacterium]|nr:DUF4493 domain-containing protein [Bacteroidaceae bacterium]
MKKIQYICACLFLVLAGISCTQDMEMDGQGYLIIKLNTVTSTLKPSATRADAPTNYEAKRLRVEIKDMQGNVVMSTNDFDNDEDFVGDIPLIPGNYTIVAHSYNWDGSGSGFNAPYYYGSSTATVTEGSRKTVKITCTQANVKVTVNYDDSFKEYFTSASTKVSSESTGVTPLQFVMGQTTQSGYFPVGNLTTTLEVTNKKGIKNTQTDEITGVQARDHYILNYKVAAAGNLGDGTTGGVTVTVDDKTNTYTYTFEVPQKMGTEFAAKGANAWSTFAMLNAEITSKTQSFQNSGITLQWKVSGAEEWNEVANDALTITETDKIQYTLKGLSSQTAYEYRIRYVEGDNEVTSNIIKFTTEQQTPLYNGGFENWWMDGKVAYANAQGTSFWDTSNQGAASFGGSNTTETTSVVHGGSKAAKLESKYIVIKFAAASLYTGSFGALIGTKGAWLNWGVPFTARPTALKGYMQYAPATINRVGSNLPANTPEKGSPDQCGMYCALLSEALVVDNTDMSTFPNWETDPRVIAYGTLPTSQNVHSNGQWKEVNIPLVYRDLTRKPTHLLVVFSASKYGDYFHGGEGSTLYLDDFELVYGNTPSVK